MWKTITYNYLAFEYRLILNRYLALGPEDDLNLCGTVCG